MTDRPAGALEILGIGASALVQDLGRPSLGHLGVPASGALDVAALRAANRLLGQGEGAPIVEALLGGLTVRLHGPGRWFATAGAVVAVSADGRPRAWGEAVRVPSGGVLRLGRPVRGARTTLAVQGGVRPAAVLGSCSTDTLSGLGPAPLRVGDLVPLGPATGAPAVGALVPGGPGRRTDPVRLRLHPGPHGSWFPEGRSAGAGGPRTVSATSDRVGLRLEGPPIRRRPGEVPSLGLPPGAVQVPPDGRPVVLLADRPTTGGYPILGVVDPRDLDACAQLLPGDAVELRPVRG